MTNQHRILLAEDDLNLGILLVDFLESEGFQVKLCKDGEVALKNFHANSYDLCLLDVMMPKLDGYSVAQEIRLQNKQIPIIFITAKSLKEDKLKAYSLEADDFIIKPFDEEELLWKIKALIRRNAVNTLSEKVSEINIGSYVFNYQNQTLSLNSSIKRITEKERDILYYLSQHKNEIVRREVMLKDIWGDDDYFMGRSLDVFITKIRKYLKDDPSIAIENVFGVGFILNVK